MNAYPDFDLGSVQPGNESESSNSVGINTPVQRDLLSPEPEIDSFQCWGFFGHTPVETQNESTSNSVPGNTSSAQAKFAGKSQLCGDNDSDSSDIQNFIRILGRCTYFESEKEDSWNQVESTKKDLAASQLTEGLGLPIPYEKPSSNSEGQQQEDSKLQSDEKYSFQDKKRKIPSFRSVVKEVITLRRTETFMEPVLEPLIRRVVKEEIALALRK